MNSDETNRMVDHALLDDLSTHAFGDQRRDKNVGIKQHPHETKVKNLFVRDVPLLFLPEFPEPSEKEIILNGSSSEFRVRNTFLGGGRLQPGLDRVRKFDCKGRAQRCFDAADA